MYLPLDSSFISNQFFLRGLDGWFDVLSNKCIIFDVPLLYHYTNLNSSIICFLFFEDIYLYFGISVSFAFVFRYNSCECNSFGDFEIFVILSAILPFKSPFAFTVFWITFFWSSFYCICFRFFSTIKKFLTIFIT